MQYPASQCKELVTMDGQLDSSLRRYARWLNQEMGEDAYHDVVCSILERGHVDQIRNLHSFFLVAIRRALFKLFRHEQSEREQVTAYLAGDPPPTAAGLQMGRQMQTHCRRGHLFTEDNLAYIGSRRTCRMCKRSREAKAARAGRARQHNHEVQHA